MISFRPVSLQELESVVRTLLVRYSWWFLAWRDERCAARWDRQMERDARLGEIDRLAEAALAEFRAGRFTKLP